LLVVVPTPLPEYSQYKPPQVTPLADALPEAEPLPLPEETLTDPEADQLPVKVVFVEELFPVVPLLVLLLVPTLTTAVLLVCEPLVESFDPVRPSRPARLLPMSELAAWPIVAGRLKLLNVVVLLLFEVLFHEAVMLPLVVPLAEALALLATVSVPLAAPLLGVQV
jgi:hypothetical protein